MLGFQISSIYPQCFQQIELCDAFSLLLFVTFFSTFPLFFYLSNIKLTLHSSVLDPCLILTPPENEKNGKKRIKTEVKRT
jgi:hypothetical protein